MANTVANRAMSSAPIRLRKSFGINGRDGGIRTRDPLNPIPVSSVSRSREPEGDRGIQRELQGSQVQHRQTLQEHRGVIRKMLPGDAGRPMGPRMRPMVWPSARAPASSTPELRFSRLTTTALSPRADKMGARKPRDGLPPAYSQSQSEPMSRINPCSATSNSGTSTVAVLQRISRSTPKYS